MLIAKAILAVIINLLIYLAFGGFVCARKDKDWSIAICLVIGFFCYYGLFALFCLPIMITYRPLSLLSSIWLVVTIVLVLASLILNAKSWLKKIGSILETTKSERLMLLAFFFIVLVQIILVTITYNFTLDAAYYVANVSTSVETNMINVYDPFTGAWQDHFELRYVFATYSIMDAVVCQLTKIPALIQTKTVMASIVVILANSLYYYICKFFCHNKKIQEAVMYLSMIFINMTFITLYTSSNFLMTRTYEGKAVVGNVSVIVIFALYMIAVREELDNKGWLQLFMVCFGTATVSSTANMIIPAQLFLLFGPYLVKHKRLKECYKLFLCMLPELVMLLVYVLYVKGFFAIYTYPR